MSAPYVDLYLDYTKPLTQDNILTYKLNRSVSTSIRRGIRQAFKRIGSDIGLEIKHVKKRSNADVIINYTHDLPDYVVGLADVIESKWWIQMDRGSLAAFHKPTASKLVLHEFGHVLGLNHHDEPGLMSPTFVSSSSYFSPYELETLQYLWGKPNEVGVVNLG